MSDFQTIQSLLPTDASYSLRDFIERFTLPQLVKVQEGYYNESQRTTIGADTVYNLLSLESVETVLFEDEDGEEARIPFDYPCTVERVAEERFQQQQLGIQQLLHKNYPGVKFVRVIESDPNYETLIKTGDKLKIDLRKKKSRDNFLSFKKVNDKGTLSWKVPASCEAKFQALLDGEELPLSRFVKKNKLPAYVCFIDKSAKESTIEDTEDKKTHYRPLPAGVVKLKGILVDSFVTATTNVQGLTSEFSFPITLPISVVPVKMEVLKSPLNEPDSITKGLVEEYEDMSGYQSKTLKSPPERKNDKTMTIAELEMSGQRVCRGNTYSPPPSTKMTRSKSMMEQKKGSDLFQRTVSNLELRTNTTESEEHVYEDLNSYLTAEKSKSSSLSRMQRRRRSDSSTDKISKHNLNNLLHVQAQTVGDESFQVKVETVSLQIRRTSLIGNKPCAKMNTFGRKGKTAETESDHYDVNTRDSILENQSYSTNPSLQTFPKKLSSSVVTNSPFYGSEEMDLETPAALKPNILPSPQVRRSSADVLPLLPTLQESCRERGEKLSNREFSLGDEAEAKGRRGLTAGKVQVLKTRMGTLPEPVQRSDNGTNYNQNSQQQLSPDNGFAKHVSTSDSDVSRNRTVDDPPPPLPLRNKHTGGGFCPEVYLTSGDKVVSCKERQPVPSPRVKSSSFHGQQKGERPMVSSADEKAPSVCLSPRGKPRSFSVEECNLPSRSDQGAGATPGVTANVQSLGTQMKPYPPEKPQRAKGPGTRFNIPQDLGALRLPEVLQCLQALNMQHFENVFKERQVDGSMLICLDEDALQSFGMDRFHRLKLLRFIAGWRPHLYCARQ